MKAGSTLTRDICIAKKNGISRKNKNSKLNITYLPRLILRL